MLRFASHLTQPLVLVLLAVCGVTAFLGEWVDTWVILAVVLINALAALARTVATDAPVLRQGKRRSIHAAELAPGDVVLLAAGYKVPADVRLLSGKELRTAEAALTGESLPVHKHHAPVPADTALADRVNMAYAGTLIVSGQGQGMVVATGDVTDTGRISRLMAQTPELTTPLTRKIAGFARQLMVVILVLAAFTFAVGVWRGESAVEMFMVAVALAVSAIPEGLPAAMTIT